MLESMSDADWTPEFIQRRRLGCAESGGAVSQSIMWFLDSSLVFARIRLPLECCSPV